MKKIILIISGLLLASMVGVVSIVMLQTYDFAKKLDTLFASQTIVARLQILQTQQERALRLADVPKQQDILTERRQQFLQLVIQNPTAVYEKGEEQARQIVSSGDNEKVVRDFLINQHEFIAPQREEIQQTITTARVLLLTFVVLLFVMLLSTSWFLHAGKIQK